MSHSVRSEPPPHYASAVEPWDAMRAWMDGEEYMGFLRGNAIKYLARMGRKGPALADAQKAAHYLAELIRELERDG